MTAEATRLDVRPFFLEDLEGPPARKPERTISQRPLRPATPDPVEHEKTPVPQTEGSQPNARLVKKRGLPSPAMRTRPDTETRRHAVVKTGPSRRLIAVGVAAAVVVTGLFWYFAF
jgi:hypothetical protein